MTCPNCVEIDAIDRDERAHPTAIARTTAGYVVLNATQYYRGATFFIARQCVAELHELDADERQRHLMEMAAVAAAVQRAVDAPKMNYEALGNTVPHLHWWLTPRHRDDPRPRGPIWEDPDFLRSHWTGQAYIDAVTSALLRRQIADALRAEDVEIEAVYV
jgi:diadenosine tetraphosphate (Ap4A) HIT family hydrolase